MQLWSEESDLHLRVHRPGRYQARVQVRDRGSGCEDSWQGWHRQADCSLGRADMAQRSAIVTVTTTATLLITGTDTDSTPSRRSVVVKNTGAATVFIGGSGVTTATGFPLAVGDTLTFQDIPPDSWPYGRVASGTVTVAVLQVGV